MANPAYDSVLQDIRYSCSTMDYFMRVIMQVELNLRNVRTPMPCFADDSMEALYYKLDEMALVWTPDKVALHDRIRIREYATGLCAHDRCTGDQRPCAEHIKYAEHWCNI